MEFMKYNEWRLVESRFSVENNKHFEGAFTTGSGYLSVRGSLEEGLEDVPQDEEYIRLPANVTLEKQRVSKSKWGTFLPGLMGPHPLLKEEIINLPYFLGIKIWFEDEKLDMESCCISDYSRSLCFMDGTLTRSFTWQTKSGAVMEIIFERFISMDIKNLSVQRMFLKVKSGSGKVRVESGIDARVRTNGNDHFESIETGSVDRYIYVDVGTDGNNHVHEMCTLVCNEIDEWNIVREEKCIFYKAERHLNTGDGISLLKLACVASDRDITISGTLLEPALYRTGCLDTLNAVKNKKFDELYQNHVAVWKKKWEYSDIVIEGCDEAQLAIRFSIFHLIRSNAEDDPRVAICAKGYAGEAYLGRFFWDTEMYLLPFYIYTNPKAARNLMMFRFNTLEGAKGNARYYGYKGARYPWESSVNGLEQCPSWQYADHEVHITADIAYAIWYYHMATGDMEFIEQYAVDILVETSRYWIGRVDRDSKTGEYNLIGVMGPDEYTPLSSNNSYTNRMVRFNLEKAVEVLEAIREKDLRVYEDKIRTLSINEEELELFKEVAKSLKIPYDSSRSLVLQCDDFYSYADLDFDAVWKDRSKPFGHFVSQERMYRSKCLKQADVIEMMRLFPKDFSTEEIDIAYRYYEPITTHDSSLSYAVHGIVACHLGKTDEAQEFLKRSLGIDISLEKRGAAEGIHIANCGGLWQLLVFGFIGMGSPIYVKQLKLDPKLPDGWTRVKLKVSFKGNRYELDITRDGYSVNLCKED